MEKGLAALVLAVFGMFLGYALMCFTGIITATILYLVWNRLAPVYFVTLLPSQFMHIPWWHCFLFTWLIGCTIGRTASVKTTN